MTIRRDFLKHSALGAAGLTIADWDSVQRVLLT